MPSRPIRYVRRAETTWAAPDPAALAGRSFALTEDGRGIAEALARLLSEQGATATMSRPGECHPADGLVHLSSLSDQAPSPAAFFGDLQGYLGAGVSSVLVTTGPIWGRDAGGAVGDTGAVDDTGAVGDTGADGAWGGVPRGAGLGGMARTVALEYPRVRVRAVELELGDDPERLARQLLSELTTRGSAVGVAYRNDRRLRLRSVPEPLVQDGRSGLGPGAGDVVLLTGGGRGITSLVAVALARRGCHLDAGHPAQGHLDRTEACLE
ncbi:MAG: hypothetical protein ACRDZY_20660, partial [Acidimicrobiales bacterium]